MIGPTMRFSFRRLVSVIMLLGMFFAVVVFILSLVACCMDFWSVDEEGGNQEFRFDSNHLLLGDRSKDSAHLKVQRNMGHLQPAPNSKQNHQGADSDEDKGVPIMKKSLTNQRFDYEMVLAAYRTLLRQMEGRWQFEWIRKRLITIWPEFEKVGRNLTNNCSYTKGSRKKIMILPGLLTLTNFAKPDVIQAGGPLGELAQWTDLIAGSLALCHQVALRLQLLSTRIELNMEMEEDVNKKLGCRGESYVDVIYTDISGYRELSDQITDAYRYKFRILDAFGTEPAYNDELYARMHGIAINHWGMLRLRPRQFYTFYPHTPDNSFLGFVVSSSKLSQVVNKENFALVIGKKPRYLKGKKQMLAAIQKLIPVRVTMRGDFYPDTLPPGVENMGVLDSGTYRSVVSKAKICIGLGDPIESPSVLEVLAAGCVFLNPERMGAARYLVGKPTSREIDSQVPYLDEYIGEPHSYHINERKLNQLTSVIQSILAEKQVEPFIPYEFTVPGFVERLDAYITYQDFCRRGTESDYNITDSDTVWPPQSALQSILAPDRLSCKQACHKKGLICEPEFFNLVNNVEHLKGLGLSCKTALQQAELFSPAFISANQTCVLQSRREIYSCAAGQVAGVQRVCPCRDFIKYQTALCRDCRRSQWQNDR